MKIPVNPNILFQSAADAYKQKHFSNAIEILEQFLPLYPNHLDAWLLLGCCLTENSHYLGAITAFQRVLELDPKTPGVYSRIGHAYENMHYVTEALQYHELAIQEKPKDSRTWMHYSVALRKANHPHEALKACEKSLMFDPKNLTSLFQEAIIYLTHGKYDTGWEKFEIRMLAYADQFLNRPPVPEWNGEPLADTPGASKTILLLSEQGFGDTIMISRFIPMVKEHLGSDSKVVLLVMEEVLPLLSHLPNVDKTFPSPCPSNLLPPIDCYLNLMSLPHRLKLKRVEDIPPPTTFDHPETRALMNKAKLKILPAINAYRNRFKIGIVWSGSVTNKHDKLRSASLEYFLEFLQIPGIELFSFQKGPREEDIEKLGLKAIVHNLGQYFNNFIDTAAAIEEMDLMITVDTAVGHLGGSLNKSTWILLHDVPYWLWLEKRIDTPWYPSVTLFRQKKLNDWKEVFKRIYKTLEKQVKHLNLSKS